MKGLHETVSKLGDYSQLLNVGRFSECQLQFLSADKFSVLGYNRYMLMYNALMRERQNPLLSVKCLGKYKQKLPEV